MIILGIGGLLGDARHRHLKDGALVAAIEESKLVRRRTHWGGHGELPSIPIAKCLELGGRHPTNRWIARGHRAPIPDPISTSSYARASPRAVSWCSNTTWRMAASAYYPSPFDESHGPHPRPRQRPPLRLALQARARA